MKCPKFGVGRSPDAVLEETAIMEFMEVEERVAEVMVDQIASDTMSKGKTQSKYWQKTHTAECCCMCIYIAGTDGTITNLKNQGVRLLPCSADTLNNYRISE